MLISQQRSILAVNFHLTANIVLLLQAMVETVNNLLQPQAQAAWMDLSTAEQLRAATMLLDTVEQGAFVLADNLLKTDVVQENTENIRKSFTFVRLAICSYAVYLQCIQGLHSLGIQHMTLPFLMSCFTVWATAFSISRIP